MSGSLRGIATEWVIEDVPVVHLLALCHLALLGITRVIESAVIGLPGYAGRARAFDGVGQKLLRGGLNDMQRAHLRATLGCAIRDILAIVRCLPPIERHRPILGKLIGVHQHFVSAVHSFTNEEHRLVLFAFTPGVEVILAAHLRLAQIADFEQLLDAVMQLIATGQLVENAARINQLLGDPLLRFRIASIFQPAVGVDNLVAEVIVGDGLLLGSGRLWNGHRRSVAAVVLGQYGCEQQH